MNEHSTQFHTDKEQNEFPISFIDVVFLLLIYFIVTFTTGLSTIPSSTKAIKKAPAPEEQKLPTSDIDRSIKSIDQFDGVRVLITKPENSNHLQYFFLGYDGDNKPQINESFFVDSSRTWTASIAINKNNDQKLLNKYGSIIREGQNSVSRFGRVYLPTEGAPYDSMRSNMALFFKYIKRFPIFADTNALDVSIKADSTVSIGVINEIIEICGINDIPNLSFIVRTHKSINYK